MLWLSEKGEGFSITYPEIILHAILRSQNEEEPQGIYCQVQAQEAETEEGLKISIFEEDEEEERPLEIRFRPSSNDRCIYFITLVDDIYEALCQCATLHPDCCDDASSDGEFYTVLIFLTVGRIRRK